MLKEVEFTADWAILRRNFGWLSLTTVGMSAAYLWLNHLPRSMVHENYLYAWEAEIPLMVGTIYPYWAALIIAFLVPLCVKNRLHLVAILTVNAVSFLLNAAVWIFYPVGYPRPPIPSDDGSLSFTIYQSLVTLDTPINSLPSGHVTLMGSLFWVALACKGWPRPMLILCSIFGTVSIFTTKQHSMVDALAGAATMVVAYALVRWVFTRTKASSSRR
jgi:hypothetical protein